MATVECNSAIILSFWVLGGSGAACGGGRAPIQGELTKATMIHSCVLTPGQRRRTHPGRHDKSTVDTFFRSGSQAARRALAHTRPPWKLSEQL